MKFSAKEPFKFPDGSVGWRPSEPSDCLGPFAKVQNCRIQGIALRRTCYATGYADTFFSVPAQTRIRNKYIGGYFIIEDGSPMFIPHNRFQNWLEQPA